MMKTKFVIIIINSLLVMKKKKKTVFITLLHPPVSLYYRETRKKRAKNKYSYMVLLANENREKSPSFSRSKNWKIFFCVDAKKKKKRLVV